MKHTNISIMWRLSAETEDRWSYYTYLAAGPTAEDAMRNVVRNIKESNAKYAKYAHCEPDPIPSVMWAIPLMPPTGVKHLGCDRGDLGEDFEGMFDYGAEVEVRL